MEMGVSGVKSILAQARRAAQRRGQEASTAHLLLAMLQGGGPVAELLRGQGVGEAELLRALGGGEAGGAMPRVLDRSAKIAEHLGHGEVSAFHLLLAIVRDRRSAAHRSLGERGLAGVQGAVLARMQEAHVELLLAVIDRMYAQFTHTIEENFAVER
ncbi:MAG: Clp protease N-terminal domain-containing protein, partial [Myxococcota bacterium]